MSGSARNKASFYIPAEMRAEIEAEGRRLDRPMSWIVQAAWVVAREQVKRFPAPHVAEQAPRRRGKAA